MVVTQPTQDLMIQTAKELIAVMVLVSVKYRNADEDCGWFNGALKRAVVIVPNDVGVDGVGPVDN